MKKSIILRGDGIVDGVLFDKAFLYHPENMIIPKISIQENKIDSEIQRFGEALNTVKRQLEKDKMRVQNELGRSEADIFQSHIVITEDIFFTEEVPALISKKKRNAEWIIFEGLKTYVDTFNNLDNIYFKERVRDIEDVSMRIIKTLQEEKESDIMKDIVGICVVKELIPSMIVHINTRRIKGIIAESGGETAHATILAKSLGIPFVLNVKNVTKKIETGDLTIIDGHVGDVIINPTKDIINFYKKTEQEYQHHLKILKRTTKLPSATKDGAKIRLSANIERIPGANIALKYGAEGIGLFRTELPFIIYNRLLGEEEQFEMYRAVLKIFEDKPVTIRTLDIGGDKFFPFQQSIPFMEANPYLGLRSIRLSLLKPDIFRIQIRALLRASNFGKIKILLPMISCYEELTHIQIIIKEEKELLQNEGIEFDDQIEVGVMIEIPSAALASEYIIKHCDFFSIGTNDLVQYTLAVDRSNERVAPYYIPENPAILELIKISAHAAVKNNKPCSICGELAGSPLFTPFFLGIGITELSMEPKLIPEVKKTIRNTTLSDAKTLAEKVLSTKKVKDIKSILKDFYDKNNPEE